MMQKQRQAIYVCIAILIPSSRLLRTKNERIELAMSFLTCHFNLAGYALVIFWMYKRLQRISPRC